MVLELLDTTFLEDVYCGTVLLEMFSPTFFSSFHMVRETILQQIRKLKLRLPLQDKQTKQLVDQFYLLTLYCCRLQQ